jgi:hypothetical protein
LANPRAGQLPAGAVAAALLGSFPHRRKKAVFAILIADGSIV